MPCIISQIWSNTSQKTIWVYIAKFISVEDRVHQLLASRLKNIQDLFGQIPDTLEDVWVEVALNKIKDAEKRISDFSENDTHPFYDKYQNQDNIKPIVWEDCADVLDNYEKRKILMQGW